MTEVPTLNVVVGLCCHDQMILITRRPADTHMALKWEFPGGKPEPGESDAEALQREFLEEVGLPIEVGGLFHEKTFDYPERRVHLRFYRVHTDSPEAVQLKQVIDAKWVRFQALQDDDFPPANKALLERLRREGAGENA